jgi:putative transposase
MTHNNSQTKELHKFCHSVGQNWYHVVLVTQRRRRLFQWKETNTIAHQAIDLVCKNHNISIFTKEVMNDHVHLFVSCPPEFSIRKLLQVLKGGTSFEIRKNYPSLYKYSSIWSKGGMYRSLGSVSADIVRRYIDTSNVWKPS